LNNFMKVYGECGGLDGVRKTNWLGILTKRQDEALVVVESNLIRYNNVLMVKVECSALVFCIPRDFTTR